MLNWAAPFNICCFLDNHHYLHPHHNVECLLAAGAREQVSDTAGSAFSLLQHACKGRHDWLFGHLGYDLKNETEQLHSAHHDGIGFPDLGFFVPDIIVILNHGQLQIGLHGDGHEKVFRQIMAAVPPASPAAQGDIVIRSRIGREEYIGIMEKLQAHIHAGDCYEINFCQEFFAEQAVIDPLSIYLALSEASPNPFSAYYRMDDKFLLCASPERYLKKEGMKLFAQPIKGTWQRDLVNPGADGAGRARLFNSAKDRSENVMVVDLVRNDLSRICVPGTVEVNELFGIYSFPQVHQMISTVSGRLREGITVADALRSTFPMGSMTGAPKKKVMELIEQYEKTKRGIFSGAVGYITPEDDFDFNVVIRSIMYNSSQHYLSFQAGSGITCYSDAVLEYEECLLKASAIRKVLGS